MPSDARKKPAQVPANAGRAHLDAPAEIMRSLIQRHLISTLARDTGSARPRDWWVATALAVRDTIHERMIATQGVHNAQNVRRIYYFSLEYLIGRLFGNNLLATGLFDTAKTALESLGQDFEEIRESEMDMGLGNGGLGRLAACFLDSLSTLDYPALGYGIYYEFGLFKQEFVKGAQIELPDNWIRFGDPWEVVRPEYAQKVQLYGRVENEFDDRGNYRPRWVGTKTVLGVPHDIPIAGYGTNTVNLLRLWASKSDEGFDLAAFNAGGYVGAVQEKAIGDSVSKVLYPNDKTESGKELRLVQQYFFVACSLRDIIRRHFRTPGNSWQNFADKVAVQLNDTHPAVAIVELMRILVDEENMTWAEAWGIANATFAYTNHTLLPEALEKWGVGLFERVLPRHLQLIFDINTHLLLAVEAKWPGDNDKKRVCSLIEENGGKLVRMANLAVAGSRRCTPRCSRRTFSRNSTRSTRANSRTRPTASPRGAGSSRPTRGSPRSSRGSSAARRGRAISTCCGDWKKWRTTPASSASSWRSSAPTRSSWPGSSRRSVASTSRPTRSSTSRSSACTNTSAST